MNILGTTNISISGVYQNDKTFGVLLLEKLYEVLPTYGVECELINDAHTDLVIGYKGVYRFIYQVKSSTSQISMRAAVLYNKNDGANNWGSTYNFCSVNSASSETQTFSFCIKLFMYSDCLCIAIYDSSNSSAFIPYFYSYPAKNVDTDKKVYINGKEGSYWPNDVTTQSNDWYISSAVSMPIADVSKCVIGDIVMYMSSVIHYALQDTYIFHHSTIGLVPGQVVEIDGEKFVCVYSNIISKYE